MSYHLTSNLIYYLIFWPQSTPCGILAPQPGIELASPVLETWKHSLNHWTSREVPGSLFRWREADRREALTDQV